MKFNLSKPIEQRKQLAMPAYKKGGAVKAGTEVKVKHVAAKHGGGMKKGKKSC